MTYQHCTTMAEETFRQLLAHTQTIASAESCTGGLLAALLTEPAGSSQVFRGGVCAYSNAAKTSLLGIDADDIIRYGAVSEFVARAMARSVRLVLNADIGLATTGIAGPSGGTPVVPVGSVWCAISCTGYEDVFLLSLSGSRSQIRFNAVVLLLNRLSSYLCKAST